MPAHQVRDRATAPPRPRIFIPSPTDAALEALRAEFPNAAIITAAGLAEIERGSLRMRGAEDTRALIAQILKGLTHYAVRLDCDLVQEAGDDEDAGSDYQIIAPVELAGETLSGLAAEVLAVNPGIKFLQVDEPGPEISHRDLNSMSRAQRDEFFKSFIPSPAIVRPIDLRLSP